MRDNKVEGPPCKRCGTTVRYKAKNRPFGQCVHCREKESHIRLARYHKRRKDNAFDLEYRLTRFIIETKRRSKAKGYDFNLDYEHLLSIWTGVCAISGIPLDFTLAEKGPNPNGPSLDRIEPELGYTKGNVRFVTYHVNTAMSCFGKEALIELAQNILRNNNG